MRVSLDLDKDIIIVPDNYFTNIDKMNDVIAKGEGTKVDYTGYIENSFKAAIDKAKANNGGLVRKSDVTVSRKK